MKTEQPVEMAYPQKIARDIIIDLARPINNHLIKLVGSTFLPQCDSIAGENCAIGSMKFRQYA
jgi:hypothetical protein